jgi:Cytochrome P460
MNVLLTKCATTNRLAANRQMPTVCLVVAIAFSVFGCAGSGPNITATINTSASLVGDLPANPLQWKLITSTVNKSDSTMSTLYGNDTAVNYARTNVQHNYPNSSAIALVTWTQRADERYYGAQIPDQVKSVEFVFVQSTPNGRPSYSYQKFAGSPLKQTAAEPSSTAADRTMYLLSQRAAVMP